jgi:hypothetical protein
MKTTQFLILISFSIATNGYAGDDINFLDLEHFGHPSEPPKDGYGKPMWKGDCDITITDSPFPIGETNVIKNTTGYYYTATFKDLGSGHSNYATIYVATPDGESTKLSIGQYYWSDRNLSLRWVSENLLFMRIWWGRHWGDDYIYNADTQKIIYSDGFSEPRISPGKSK